MRKRRLTRGRATRNRKPQTHHSLSLIPRASNNPSGRLPPPGVQAEVTRYPAGGGSIRRTSEMSGRRRRGVCGRGRVFRMEKKADRRAWLLRSFWEKGLWWSAVGRRAGLARHGPDTRWDLPILTRIVSPGEGARGSERSPERVNIRQILGSRPT